MSLGVGELESGAEPLGRARRPGGGPQAAAETDPGLVPALLALVEPDERGDPMSPLRWTTKSPGDLAGELTAPGAPGRRRHGGRAAAGRGVQPAGQRQDDRGQAAPGPGRASSATSTSRPGPTRTPGEPVISVDAKKKEQVGEYASARAREWRPTGDPVQVARPRLPRPGQAGKAIPYGIYDLAADTGWVNVGHRPRHRRVRGRVDPPLVEAAAAARDYPGARRLLITADAGGSNGYRTRAWKAELAALAARDRAGDHRAATSRPARRSGTSAHDLAATPE